MKNHFIGTLFILISSHALISTHPPFWGRSSIVAWSEISFAYPMKGIQDTENVLKIK